MKSIAVYPGKFDPITNGHSDLALRGARLFEKVIVGVSASPTKEENFSHAERVALASAALADLPNVTVVGFDGLLVDFVRHHQAQVVLRGLRAVADFEYEFQLASMNRSLYREMETLFLIPNEKYTFLSSTLLCEVARLGGEVSKYVCPAVLSALKKRFSPTPG